MRRSEGEKQVTPSRLIPSTEAAAFLVHEGLPVRGCHPDGRGCAFIFDDTPILHEHLLRFTNGQGTVEPRAFLRALNDLRDLARSYTQRMKERERQP
jgi:hypothetical protein